MINNYLKESKISIFILSLLYLSSVRQSDVAKALGGNSFGNILSTKKSNNQNCEINSNDYVKVIFETEKKVPSLNNRKMFCVDFDFQNLS